MKIIVGINSFVRRQTEKSGKTCSKKMTFEDIAEYASKQIIEGNYKKGYRDGVILVPIKKLKMNLIIMME